MATESLGSERIPVEFRDAIRKEVINQSAKWVIAGVITLITIAAAGWWLYFLPKLTSLVGGVPSGAVVAFDLRNGCPAGWQSFDDSNGRFILGSGKGEGLTLRPFGQPGGEETHKLTVLELPAHTHSYSSYVFSGSKEGKQPAHIKFGGGSVDGETKSTGQNEAFQIIPPYIALRYCVKS